MRMLDLVLVKLLAVHRSKYPASVSPFVKVLGEKTFQLQAATLIQIIDARRHTLERDTTTKKQGHEVSAQMDNTFNFAYKNKTKNRKVCLNIVFIATCMKKMPLGNVNSQIICII